MGVTIHPHLPNFPQEPSFNLGQSISKVKSGTDVLLASSLHTAAHSDLSTLPSGKTPAVHLAKPGSEATAPGPEGDPNELRTIIFMLSMIMSMNAIVMSKTTVGQAQMSVQEGVASKAGADQQYNADMKTATATITEANSEAVMAGVNIALGCLSILTAFGGGGEAAAGADAAKSGAQAAAGAANSVGAGAGAGAAATDIDTAVTQVDSAASGVAGRVEEATGAAGRPGDAAPVEPEPADAGDETPVGAAEKELKENTTAGDTTTQEDPQGSAADKARNFFNKILEILKKKGTQSVFQALTQFTQGIGNSITSQLKRYEGTLQQEAAYFRQQGAYANIVGSYARALGGMLGQTEQQAQQVINKLQEATKEMLQSQNLFRG